MINISKYRYLILFFLAALTALFFFIASRYLVLDNALHKVLPMTEETEQKFFLSSYSSFARKIILYVEDNEKQDGNEARLKKHTYKILDMLEESDIGFTTEVPTEGDIQQMLFYIQKNSLMLYNYKLFPNPFSPAELARRIKAKADFVLSSPFFMTGELVTNDPLLMSGEIIKTLPDLKQTGYRISEGMIFSGEPGRLIVPFSIDIKPDDYSRTIELEALNEQIASYGAENNVRAFLFSSHFYYLESSRRIKGEVTLLSVISLLLTLVIFYFFFKDIKLTLFAFIPIVFSLSAAFLAIGLFTKSFNSISLAFCATTVGISIDYTIHYLVKKDHFDSLADLRSRIGPSLILGFVTTLATFFFLPFSKIGSLTEIAVVGIIVISLSFLVSWFIIQPIVKEKKSTLLQVQFPRIKKGFLIWLFLLAPLLLALPFLKFETQIANLDYKHEELNSKMEAIKAGFSQGIDSLLLVFYGESKDMALSESLRGFNEVYEADKEALFFTPAAVNPPESVVRERKKYIEAHFNPAEFQKAVDESIFTEDTFKAFTDTAGGAGFAIEDVPDYVKKYDTMSVKWKDRNYLVIPIPDREQLYRIDTILKGKEIGYYIIDTAAESSRILYVFEKKTLFLLLLSLLVIFLILFVSFRKITYAFTALLPSAAALAACLGLSVLLRKDFNIMHLTSCILILGIGVDYGIFITMALVKKVSSKEYNLTLQSILISALTTLAGFGVLMFSSHNALSSLGSSMFIGIIAAFATAYLAVPWILGKNK